jgi:hypothetical protein
MGKNVAQKRGRGRPGINVALAAFYGTKDIGPKLVNITEGAKNIKEACAMITAETGVLVNPIPLRSLFKADHASTSPRIRKSSTLTDVCTRGRGRPAKSADVVAEPADVTA